MGARYLATVEPKCPALRAKLTSRLEEQCRFLSHQRPGERRYGVGLSTPVPTVCVLVFAARNRPLSSPCRDDSIGFGSLQLQIFQKLLRAADEFHVGARRKPKRDSDFLYERHAIVGIKIVRWLRVFPPTVRDSKHRPILFVADWKRKMRLAHRDVVVWHRDDKTFYRLPSYGR